ncbi:hypothetical protein Nepgr_004401 [Nepenthes gracilis]|uniref:Uncharacterized protein n=1 Tax=Nepenthes gracilis TaxID=150966 RepID=A0AAD3XF51_NEPGR|nr:hypothetical protein Nepgr_004401 [Nepenthes gracilis]
MATKARVLAAYRAMKDLGISEQKTKPVLKNLLKVYDRNWGPIEEENYRVLADAIFEYEDTEVMEKKKCQSTDQEALEQEAQENDELERPLKRLRLRYQGQEAPSHGQPIQTGGSSLKKPKVEPGAPEPLNQQSQGMTQSPKSNVGSGRAGPQPVSTPSLLRNKGKQPVSAQIDVGDKVPQLFSSPTALSGKNMLTERTSNALHLKEPRAEMGIVPVPKSKLLIANALIKPKDEPFTDGMPPDEVPLAIVHPESLCEGRPSNANGSVESLHLVVSDAECVNGVDKCVGAVASSGKQEGDLEVANIPVKSPTTLEIAASPLGEVKISLNCEFALDRPNFHVPSIDEVMKYMEDKCLRSYKIIDPSFSVTNLMRDFCESFLVLGNHCTDESLEKQINITPVVDVLKESTLLDAIGHGGNDGTTSAVCSSWNGSVNAKCSDSVAATHVSDLPLALHSPGKHMHSIMDSVDDGCGEKEPSSSMDMNSKSIVVGHHCQLDPDEIRRLHDVNDITRGEEKVKVLLLYDSNSESLPSFYYIPQSVVFQNAELNFSLSQIGDEDCCPTCSGDCSPLVTPCACTCRNGGDFAYSSDGLVKEEYLEECVAMVRNPQKQRLMYCKECPVERCKNEDMLEPCKGHLYRKFIKECWSKCGCSKYCANRVVQRGITCKLQVFLTPEGKGWGLRTLEVLPKGAFVCEYVGEILTIMELHRRKLQGSGDKHSYSVLLDADWGSGVITSEQALCLDATSYGNVARFINHRCLDANLVQIPIEVDTPNHMYYRVAFFTAREVDAFEELTWDYGIDFDDHDHHFKSFDCLCSSSFCRDMKRSNRSKSASISR